MRIYVDLETFATVDINSGDYYTHPDTRILLIGYQIVRATTATPVRVFDATLTDSICSELALALREPDAELYAFNANFDAPLLRRFGYALPRTVRCTLVHAWALSFAGGLNAVADQLGLAGKLPGGKRLISRFCKPAPKNHKTRRYTRDTSPDLWADFKRYCGQDVQLLSDIQTRLDTRPLPDHVWDEWEWSNRINQRGVPVDRDLINSAIARDRHYRKHVKARLTAMTGIDNPGSVPQFRAWLESQGVSLPNLQKDTVNAYLAAAPPDLATEALTLRREISGTSSKKWQAYKQATRRDGRVAHMFAFLGASRTGRFSGRVVQLQNLARGWDTDKLDLAIDLIKSPLDESAPPIPGTAQLVKQTVRAAIRSEGAPLVVADLNSIEPRVMAWLTGEATLLATFHEGRDPYRDFATHVYSCDYGEVTREMRTFCKPAVLGCGYRLGADPGLVNYAASSGVSLTSDRAKDLVHLWRRLHPRVCRSWQDLQALSAACLEAPNQPAYVCRCAIAYRPPFLQIRLPSQRTLYYYRPEMREVPAPWDPDQSIIALTYMGKKVQGHGWTRNTTHGGKLLENITQAIARDVLVYQMRQMSAAGVDLIAHVHDEVIAECGNADPDTLRQRIDAHMSESPPWAIGLTVAGEGVVVPCYQKI